MTTSASEELAWTVGQVAAALQVSTDTVYGLAARGEIPCVRLGTALRFPVREVRQWLSELTEGGTVHGLAPGIRPVRL